MKRTPLYERYSTYSDVKLIDFGGWELPVQFATGILAEHEAVRTKAGLFDVSHMGECLVSGDDADSYLDYLCTNSISDMTVGQCRYTLMCSTSLHPRFSWRCRGHRLSGFSAPWCLIAPRSRALPSEVSVKSVR